MRHRIRGLPFTFFLATTSLIIPTACSRDASPTAPARRLVAHVPSRAVGTTASGATLVTDKDDYSPGDTLKLSGTGWTPSDSLDVVLDESPQNHPPVSWAIGVGADGAIADSSYVVQLSDAGVTFSITATSRATGETAQATFTDGNFSLIWSGASNFSGQVEKYNGNSTCTGSSNATVTGTVTNSTGTTQVASGAGAGQSLKFRVPLTVGSTSFASWSMSAGESDTSSTSDATYAYLCVPETVASFSSVITANYAATAIATTTTVLASPEPSVFGQSVTFTATVTPASGPAATGTVNFYEFTGAQNCDALGTATALGSDATAPFEYTTSTLSVGSHTITACYVPDAGWTKSFGSTTHVVNKAAVTVGLSDNPLSTEFGQNVTFTATVTATSPGAGTPTGTVTFYEFTAGQSCTTLNGATALGTDTSSPWTLTTDALPLGTNTITACYGGDGNFNAGDASDTHEVTAATTTTTIAVSPTSQQYSDKVVFTATVSPAKILTETLTGSVQFKVGGVGTGLPVAVTCGATTCTATLTYTVGVGVDKSPLAISAAFTSTNDHFASSASTTDAQLTVTLEDATVYNATVSPSQILVGNGGTLTFNARETNPEKNADQTLIAAGDISNATFSATAKGVLNPSNTITLTCNTITNNGLTGYAKVLTVTCTFGSVTAADTYDVDIEVTGNYYTGSGDAIIQVTDPSLGFATGGGWYTTAAGRVNFGFMAKATVNKQKTVFQGSLLVLLQTASGDIIKVKSNVFNGYTITSSNSCSSVTMSGKANWSLNGGTPTNYSFVGYGLDCGEPGTGDRFGLYLPGAPTGVATSTTLAGLPASAVLLSGGNIQVPQPQGGK